MGNVLTGQWKGKSNAGSFVLINITQVGSTVVGRVSVFESTGIKNGVASYWTWSVLTGEVDDHSRVKGKTSQPSVHDKSGDLLTDQNLGTLMTESGTEFPTESIFHGKLIKETALEVEWTSYYPSGGTRKDKIIVEKKAPNGSRINHEKMTWGDFKNFALSQEDGLVYRGQARNWRLQTSFHRTGHADLISYLDEKIPELEHHINAYSEHIYDIKNDRSLGALLNLAQHHGYPTPLLDWTKSPYVAAFFAFQNKSALKKDGSVSIFVFDERSWANRAGRVAQLRTPAIVLRTIELPGFGNARVLPQQALTMYSNVDDLEFIIQENEEFKGQFIRAISISAAERDVAMRDLSLMGITWGSMFPGLDGICKQLASRHF